MSKAVIGALRVNLGMNSAQFHKGMSKAQISMQKFARAAAVAMAGAAAATTGAFVAIKGAAERADEAFKVAQSLGVPIDELGKLQHAAEMSGASFSDLQTGLRKGSQSIVTAMRGMSSESTKAFDDLGVSVKNADGTAKSITDVLGDVAEQFSKMPDGVKKTNAAMSIFGRSGTALIPMLNQGREGLKAMGDEAERLGLVFSGKTGAASEIFNDNLARLGKTMTGVWNRILAEVIPTLAALTNKFVEASQQGGTLDNVVRGISGVMKLVANAISLAFDNLHHLYNLFKIFVAAKTIGFIASLAGAFVSLAKTIRVAGLASALFSKAISGKITLIAGLTYAIMELTGTTETFVAKMKEIGDAVANALPENLKKVLADMAGPLNALEGQIGAVDDAVAISMGRYLNYGNTAANSFAGISPKIKTANDNVADLTNSTESFADKAKSAFSTVGSSIRGLIDGSKSWLDVLGDILTSIGKMVFQNTNFGGGLGGNILQGLFGGLFGFAKGGTIMPGGTGGIDSQLVAFRKSPNERVDITKPGQTLTSGGMDGELVISLAPGLKAEWLGEANQNAVQIVQPVAKAVGNASRSSDRRRF